MGMILDFILIVSLATFLGWACWYGFMALMRPSFNKLRNEMGRDYGHITSFKALSLTEKEARRIYGDKETDRFLQHGDYNEHMQRITYDPMYDEDTY